MLVDNMWCSVMQFYVHGMIIWHQLELELKLQVHTHIEQDWE